MNDYGCTPGFDSQDRDPQSQRMYVDFDANNKVYATYRPMCVYTTTHFLHRLVPNI